MPINMQWSHPYLSILCALESTSFLTMKADKPRATKRCNSFVALLLLLVACQNITIYILMSGTSANHQFSKMIESMMDMPSEISRSLVKKKERDVIVYLAQFSNVHSSYGAQSDASSKNITGLSKFKKSLDLCTSLFCLCTYFMSSLPHPWCVICSTYQLSPTISLRHSHFLRHKLPAHSRATNRTAQPYTSIAISRIERHMVGITPWSRGQIPS